MPKGVPIRPTAAQIAKYGHIAALVRKYMTERDITPVQLGHELNVKGASMTIVYKWMAAKAAPGPKFRNKLAKLMGVSPSELEPRHVNAPRPMQQAAINPLLLPMRKAASDALQFNVDSDGEARLRLDVKLPLDKGTALLRLILDANVLLADQQENTA